MKSEETLRLEAQLAASNARDTRELARWCMRTIRAMTTEQQIAILARLEDIHDRDDRNFNPFNPTAPRPGQHGLCEFENGKCKYCGFDEYEVDT